MPTKIEEFHLCKHCLAAIKKYRGRTIYIPKRTPIDFNLIHKWRKNGLSIAEIAKRVDVTPRHASRLLSAKQ